MNAGWVQARTHGRHRAKNRVVRDWRLAPTGDGADVGRGGAIAVALGIGAAVAGASGIPMAHADDPPSQDGDNPSGGGGVESGGTAAADTPSDEAQTPAASSSAGPIARLFPRFRLMLPGIPLLG